MLLTKERIRGPFSYAFSFIPRCTAFFRFTYTFSPFRRKYSTCFWSLFFRYVNYDPAGTDPGKAPCGAPSTPPALPGIDSGMYWGLPALPPPPVPPKNEPPVAMLDSPPVAIFNPAPTKPSTGFTHQFDAASAA